MMILSTNSGVIVILALCMFSLAVVSASSCTQDNDCGDNGKCGRSQASTDAALECCASGKTSWEGISLRYVCTGLSSGAACNGENELCTSGICGIDNVCLDERIADGESCRDSNMCASGACGRSQASTDATLECCASGKTSWEGVSLRYVCTDLIPGAACNEDDICWSKSCGLDGVCTKQVDGGSCFVDVDCQSNICGKVEAAVGASYVCCPNGESVYDDIDGVCTSFGGEGAVCFDDSTCKSGICIQQTCKDKQENENDLCEADHHCASASCIMGACAPFSSTNARNEYFNGKAVCPLETLSPANDGDTSIVSLDVYGDSTDTSWTDSMMNMVTTPSVDSSATTNTLVGQELLYGVDGCVKGGSMVVQRQGNKVCYGYQKEEDDGDGNSSFTCSNKCTEIGTSESFETYDKGDLDCIGGVFGVPVQCFYFGKSEKCRIKATVSTSQPNQTEDSNPTSGSAIQPNQAKESNPTSGSAIQPNQAKESTSASQVLASAYSPSFLLLVQIFIFVAAF